MKDIKQKLSAALHSEKLTSTSVTALIIGVIIAVNVIVYTITAIFGLYWIPGTEDYDLSISNASEPMFEEALKAGKKVKVMFCRPRQEMPTDISTGTDEAGIFYLTAEKFKEKYPEFIEFEFVDLITKRNSEGEVVDLSKYQIKDEAGEAYPLYEASVIFICENRHKTVIDVGSASFVFDENVTEQNYRAYSGEEVFASMVAWVLRTEHKKAQFTTLHSEQVDASFANMLACAGYEVDSVNLRLENIDPETDLIVISNPQSDFADSAEGTMVKSELDKLREFVSNGGNVYVSIDPYVEKLISLEAFLAEYGISYYERVDGLCHIVKDNNNAITMDRVTIVAGIADNDIGDGVASNVDGGNSAGILISQAARLDLKGKAKPLLVTSGAASTYAGNKLTDSSGNYCVGAISHGVDKKGNESGSIFVVPSVYLTANDSLVAAGYENRDFMYSVLENVYGGEKMPYNCNTIYLNTDTLQNLTTKMMRVYTVLVFLIPAALAVTGAVIVVRRKNR